MPHLIIPQPPQTYRGNTKRFDLNRAIFLPFEIKTFISFVIFSLAGYSQWFAGHLKYQIKWIYKKRLLILSLFLSLGGTHQLRSTAFYQAQRELAHKSSGRHTFKNVLMLFLHSRINQYMWPWMILRKPETSERTRANTQTCDIIRFRQPGVCVLTVK